MTDSSSPIIFLSGAGGGAPDFDVFRAGVEDATRFEAIGYPGWERSVADRFSAEALIADLVGQIESESRGDRSASLASQLADISVTQLRFASRRRVAK